MDDQGLQLLREFSNEDSVYHDPDGGALCIYCWSREYHSVPVIVMEELSITMVMKHDSSCLWQRAKDYVKGLS